MGKVKKMTKRAMETALEKVYSEKYRVLTGVTATMSRKFVKAVLAQAIRESKEAGTYGLPPEFGDALLKQELCDEAVKRELDKKRDDGVIDDEIRKWWSLPDIERRLLLKLDEANRVALFLKLTTFDKMSRDDASKTVIKYHPVYGDPEDTSQWDGEDRPLPPELRERVNFYAEKVATLTSEEQQSLLDSFSSLNARIRHEIKEGKL
jgi:hypothetical protein